MERGARYNVIEHTNRSRTIAFDLDGVMVSFKDYTPDFSASMCSTCSLQSICTEWIIAPRLEAETGELSLCLLNRENRLNAYELASKKDLTTGEKSRILGEFLSRTRRMELSHG